MDEPVRTGGEGPQPEAMHPGPIVPRRRVLIVNDDETSAHSLALILRLEGYDAQAAPDGESALRVARAFRPEAVLSDIGLPGIDGHELARRMRRDRDLSAGLKLLAAVTGEGEPEARPPLARGRLRPPLRQARRPRGDPRPAGVARVARRAVGPRVFVGWVKPTDARPGRPVGFTHPRIQVQVGFTHLRIQVPVDFTHSTDSRIIRRATASGVRRSRGARRRRWSPRTGRRGG